MKTEDNEIMETAARPPGRDGELCARCVKNARPFCFEPDRPEDCPWTAASEYGYAEDEGIRICRCCGKEFFVPYPPYWTYTRQKYRRSEGLRLAFYCRYHCFRVLETGRMPPPLKGEQYHDTRRKTRAD